MRSYRGRGPREIDVVRVGVAGEAFDVLRISKRVFALGRSVTPDAVESESGVRISEWRIVVVDTLRLPDLGPVPAVLRALAVFDHDGPAVDSFRRPELIAG